MFTKEKDPNGLAASDPGAKLDFGKDEPVGIKHDKGKPRIGYMIKEQFPLALTEVAKVSTFGIEKYGEGNWQHVEKSRYVDAGMRHAVEKGNNDDTGLLHLAHEAWNILAQLELTLRGKDATK